MNIRVCKLSSSSDIIVQILAVVNLVVEQKTLRAH